MRREGERGTRKLRRPDPGLQETALPALRLPARSWFRVHRSDLPAVSFGLLPFHRYSHPQCPHQILYLAPDIPTCLWEVFGDDLFDGRHAIAATKWTSRVVSEVALPELQVCALDQEKTRDILRVDKASLLAVDLSVPQAWGLAIQTHPGRFQGIQYASRFVDRNCLALFDQPGLVPRIQASLLGNLNELDAAIDWLNDRGGALV